MFYINIDKSSLDIAINTRRVKGAITVPVSNKKTRAVLDPLASLIYFEYIYPKVYEKQSNKNVRYKLVEPDPWLIAIAGIMWEGIIQGLSWDIIKLAVNQALAKLQDKGLAPDDQVQNHSKTSKLELGFHYIEYASQGQKKREMFLGLRKAYKRKSELERLIPTRTDEYNKLRDELNNQSDIELLRSRKSKKKRK